MTRIYSATFQIPAKQADALGDYYMGRGALSSTSGQVDSDTTELTILATRKSWFKSVGISAVPTEVRPSDWKYISHNDRPTVTLIPRVTILAEGTSTNTLPGIQIILDPKDAFGDGHHPTTQLCASYLQNLTSRAPITSLLDVGCGTGVLSILAHHLNIPTIHAIDIEMQSIRKTKKNARLNHCNLTVKQGDVLTWSPPIKYDIVIANLLTTVIEHAFSRLITWVTPNGFIILSGVSTRWRPTILTLIHNHGYQAEVSQKDDWCGFLITRTTGRKFP